jgi:hypothetical protein
MDTVLIPRRASWAKSKLALLLLITRRQLNKPTLTNLSSRPILSGLDTPPTHGHHTDSWTRVGRQQYHHSGTTTSPRASSTASRRSTRTTWTTLPSRTTRAGTTAARNSRLDARREQPKQVRHAVERVEPVALVRPRRRRQARRRRLPPLGRLQEHHAGGRAGISSTRAGAHNAPRRAPRRAPPGTARRPCASTRPSTT